MSAVYIDRYNCLAIYKTDAFDFYIRELKHSTIENSRSARFASVARDVALIRLPGEQASS